MTQALEQNGQQSGLPVSGFAFGGVGGDALRSLLRLMVKRMWWAIGCLALALLASIAYLIMTPATYRAATTLEIFRDEGRQISPLDGEFRAVSSVDREFYETQFGLLRSPALARDTARRLRLASDDDFMGRKPEDKKPTTAAELASAERGAAGKLVGNLQVVPTRESRLVELRFVDEDPVRAAKIANAVADIYIRSNLVRRIERTDYAREFLSEQIADTRGKLEEQERRLVDYAANAGIISVPTSGGNEKDKGASQTAGTSLAGIELAAMSSELANARAARASAQGKVSAFRSGLSQTEVLNNNAISALLQRRALLRGDAARLATQFDDNYPPLMAVRNEANQIDQQISQLSGQIKGSVDAEYRAATQREATIQAKVDALTGQLTDLSRKSIQYNILQRDVDTSRVQYESLLQRLKQVSVANDVGSSNVSVIQKAEPPTGRFAPVPFRIIILGLFAGALLAIGVVLLLELLDSSVTSPEDAQERFDVPLIGVTPTTGTDEPLDLIADPKSALSEAYLSAHANLRFTSGTGAPRVLSITSTQASEGKSTTAIAMSAIFARQGERVLLVDCDMRRPSLHKRLNVSNDTGFANLLAGDQDVAAVTYETRFKGVSLIPAGPHPPSPAELLSDPRLAVLLAGFKEKYDRVILDSPPILGLADAPLIGSVADGTLFVVEAGNTRTGAVRRSIQRLRDLRGNVTGLLLTKYQLRRAMFSEYGYGAYEYYGYGKRKSEI